MATTSNLAPDGGDRLGILDFMFAAMSKFSINELIGRTFQFTKSLGKMRAHSPFNQFEMKTAAIAQNATDHIIFECEQDEGMIITGIDLRGTDLDQVQLIIKNGSGKVLMPYGVSQVDGTLQSYVTATNWRFPAKSYIELKKGDKLDLQFTVTAAAGDTITANFEVLDPNLNMP